MKHDADTTVFVGMSGGVDSSVAAALLMERGFDVVGCYIRCWSGPTCSWEDDIRDARAVADQLGIPFYVINLEAEYRERVVGEMLREYAAGRTPNPDVACNREIKFGLFLQKALELGANFVATGHYARLRREAPGSNSRSRIQLLAGVDKNKDQSYFLWTLGREQLLRTLFPIGDYTKQQVRSMAEERRLPTAQKKDSQGVCFIGDINVQTFLRDHLPRREGTIITVEGEHVGIHDGSWFYTTGQRQGLGIGGGTPYYVVATNREDNIVFVAPGNNHPALYTSELTADVLSWIAGDAPKLPHRCMARIRYRQPLQTCTIYPGDTRETVCVVFDHPQRAVTGGQSVVWYDDDAVVGGGVIVQQKENSHAHYRDQTGYCAYPGTHGTQAGEHQERAGGSSR